MPPDASSPKIRAPVALLIAGAIGLFAAIGGAASAVGLRSRAQNSREIESRPIVARSIGADSISRARQDSINRSLPGYVVDSILPLEESVRRFRIGLPSAPAQLRNAAASRAQLVAAFVKAIERSDSTALGKLAIDRAEFAYLIYPESPYTRPPYAQPPGLVWMTIQNPSFTGARRLLERFGGKRLGVRSVECPLQPERQGVNRLWAGCTLLVSMDGAAPVRRRLFGTIIERAGRFKFVSYRNDL